MNQPRKLGSQDSKQVQPSQSRSADVLADSKSMIVKMGDRIEAASKRVGVESASYLYERSMQGTMAGLEEGFEKVKNPYEDITLEIDDDFFKFPPSGSQSPQRLGSSSSDGKALPSGVRSRTAG